MRLSLRAVSLSVFVIAGLLAVDAARADGPFQFFGVTPCRVYDSRADGDGPVPLPNGLHSVRFQGVCGVPVGAKAVTINVTVVSPNKNGHVTIWPVGASEPVVSTLNFVINEPALANGAIVPVGPDGGGANDVNFRYSMQAGPGTGHIIFDVTGYFL